MSAQVGYVGHHADHLVTPVEGNQALPGVGRSRRPGRRRPRAGRSSARSRWSPRSRRRPRAAGSKYNSMQASVRQRCVDGVEFLASYTLAKGTTNNRGFYGVFGGTGLQGVTSATEGRVLAEHLRPRGGVGPGVPRRAPQLHLLGAPTSCRSARAARTAPTGPARSNAILGGWRLGGIFQARTGLPDHRHRRPRALAAGRARLGAAELRRRSGSRPTSRSTSWLDINAFAGGAARHVRQLPGRRRARAGLHEPRSDAVEAVRRSAARATPSSGSRRSTR